jgi:hypothetical protein
MTPTGVAGSLDQGVGLQEGACWASYLVLKDIMQSSPEVLAHALIGVFPREDPCASVWSQPKGMALEGGTTKGQSSGSAAISAMFAVMKTYGCLEASFGHLNDAHLYSYDERCQLR